MKRIISIFVLMFLLLYSLSSAALANYTFTTIEYPGAIETSALGINDFGTVVGSYIDSNGWHGFLYNGVTYSSFDYPGLHAATGINNSGTIVGYDFSYPSHGFVKDGETYTSFDYPSATQATQAWDINNAGTVVGVYNDLTGGNYNQTYVHGFLKTGETYTSFDYPDAFRTYALGINDSGTIVGYYDNTSGKQSGFVKNGDTYTSFAYPGADDTVFWDINNSGYIVGYYRESSPGYHAFVNDGNAYTLVDYPGSTSSSAFGINEEGDIVGYYYDASGVGHSYLASLGPITNKMVTDIDPPGFNPAYWTGDDMNNTGQLLNADPRTEEAWLEALLGKDYDDPSVNLIYRILKGTGGLGLDDKSLTDFDPGFLWAYAVVKYDGMWIAYENNGINNLLTTDTFDWGISHITFFGPTSVPEPTTILLLGLGLIGLMIVLVTVRRKVQK